MSASRGPAARSSADPSHGWGPTVERSGRATPVGATVLVAARALAILLVLALTAGPLWLSSRIPREEVEGLAARGRPLNVLITGSDSREDLTDEEREELSTGSAAGERTDTILVLSVRGTRAAILAFPRDLLVERCDGSVGRINAAVGIGGPSCLVDTVRRVSGLPIHHHIALTFSGFRDLVDAVGGVEVCLEDPIQDRSAGIDLPAGCQRLAGPDALGYVRVRKIDDDLRRIQRQQRFIRALATEMLDPMLLVRPWRIVAIGNGLGEAMAADEGLGPIRLVRLAVGGRGLARGTTVSAIVPVEPAVTEGGAAVLRIRDLEAERLFASFRDGSVFDDASPDGPPS